MIHHCEGNDYQKGTVLTLNSYGLGKVTNKNICTKYQQEDSIHHFTSEVVYELYEFYSQ